ncbi:hypothetical protein EG240_09370 [Paenimyroides tangerinum]|uniref:Uncharacterized protein n=1 Tax=Paenimyroides tangerinum TaxID=2488728 RepID=A0A3P3W8J0_9FLAO|nr:hypothetical protein [Paenimyroides tangerinum]RRJ90306.1 hypothetical protein EG240_09370 [Paenimyroides tangerinum]
MNGTPNSEGGFNYYYKGDGTEKIPEIILNKISIYPNCTTTSINITKDANNDLQGNLYFFTNDDFEKVKNFYKSKTIEIIYESNSNLRFKINNEEITITSENIYDGDPIQNQNKFKIYFS